MKMPAEEVLYWVILSQPREMYRENRET